MRREYGMGSTILNFGLLSCKLTKKCAKSTILSIKVITSKYKCHQKIPWVQFAGNNISNYGLNTADSIKKLEFL